jgi:lipopolysaccharide export system permease protein
MKILRRYILREHIGPFVAALGVLTGLMLLNQLAKRFGDLVGKGLPWYVIGEVFGLSVPFIVAMTMPMAVLVAVLYTFGRLSSDNEITAIKAGGVGLLRFVFPVLVAASVVAAGMVWFNDRLLPESNHKLRTLLTDIGRKQPTFELRERVINEVVDSKLFLQAARIDRLRSVLWDLVIFDVGRPSTVRTIYADSGHMAFNETQTDLYLTLFDGSMHELETGRSEMEQRTYYDKQVIRVLGVTNELERGRSADWRGDREMNIEMMREEVARRRARLNELTDTTSAMIAAATPIRVRAQYRGRETIPLGSEADTQSVSGSDLEANMAMADRIPARPAVIRTRADESPASEPEDPGLAAREQIKARFRASRANAYPPEGDAVAFAALMHNDLQRLANRRDLQRRELNRYSVEIQKKYAIPIAAIVFVLIGAPIGVRFPRGGIGMVIGVSLTVFCVYYVFLIGGEELADRSFLSPFWAMWAPNVLFTAVGCATLAWVSRGGTRRIGPLVSLLRRLSRTQRRAGRDEPDVRKVAA